MRTFIVVCLLAVASADKLGYNYQPVAHDEPLQGESVLSTPIEQPAPVPQPAPQPVPQPAPAVEEYQKEFYSYSAPDHEFESGDNGHLANSLKKNLRVVFIKGPETHGLEDAALQLARQAGDERTAIYVLQKQSDVSGLANQLQNIRSQSQNRPEVHFVKYRTPQDAQNAQQAIRSQYDQLPGVSRNSNEGTAPVLNFASQAPVAPVSVPSAPGQQYLPSNPVPQSTYLPPSLRRFLRL